MTAELAKKIVIDRPNGIVTINGKEFPYMLLDESISFVSASSTQLGIIYLPVIAQDVEFRESPDG